MFVGLKIKSNMKTKFIKAIFISLAILSTNAFSQSNIVNQSFEGNSGTWNYSSLPGSYTVYNPATDIWGICGTSYNSITHSTPQTYSQGSVVAPFHTSISTASDGNHYWGVRDIINPYSDTVWTSGGLRDSTTLPQNVQTPIPAFGGAFWHTIDFDPVPVPVGSPFDIKLAFDYFINQYDSGDRLGYQVAFDNGTDWDSMTVLVEGFVPGNTSPMWQTFEITVPDSSGGAPVTHVRLRVGATQNGDNDHGAFDNFRVFLDIGDLTPPTITSVSAVVQIQLYVHYLNL